ncbi:PREDICTED: probable WRKY transcription factor 64 [Tarenaya hassleriana]|uniref:probable WRKY transcription factor 64 n=1 Tax=Tarenaya hassleriana TaxID=28532 RepID=UPI00053C3F95|nr:PREDICTED: probable WRKY transcription factor 64 [Tarenaya hassleriana]
MDSAVEPLVRGQKSARELKKKIQNQGLSVEAEDLAESVINSFSSAISHLTNSAHPLHHRSSDFSSNSTASSSHIPRRPSKRNRQADEVCSRQDSPFPNYPDGFVWRKYGQKCIKSSPLHQRSYYKCAYMEECNAKKHVQKIQDNPPVYQTTYLGRHTCQHDQTPVFQILSDSAHDEVDGSRMIHFGKLDQETNPVFTSTGPVNNHREVSKDDQMSQDDCIDQFFADDVELWPLDSPASSAGDIMIGSSQLDLSDYDPFRFMI